MAKKDPFGLAKINFFQDVISCLMNLKPYALDHNLGKYDAIRHAHFLTGIEAVEGDYLEFGVFTGSSFAHSVRSYKKLGEFNQRKGPVRFFGFDSFEGFGESEDENQHPFFQDSNFVWPVERVLKRASKLARNHGVEARIIKGFFDETLRDSKKYEIEKASVIFMDCDLHDATRRALEFCTELIQDGTILLMDEYFYFQGKAGMTPYGAFIDWCATHQIGHRVIRSYGIGSAIIILQRATV